jgi:hypothetical protein
MAAFLFRLETPEGVSAEPPTFASVVPKWKAGDTITLGRTMLRVSGSETAPQTNRRCWSLRT